VNLIVRLRYALGGIGFLSLLAVQSLGSVHASSPFAGGSGTSGSPYQIATCTQLQAMDFDDTAHYILTTNIDCSASSGWNSGAGFAPIGQTTAFSGTLDGQSFGITGLTINRPSTNQVGLFAQTSTATVQNITFTNAHITGGSSVGIVSGYSYGSTFENLDLSGPVSGGGDQVGGIVGFFYRGTIVNDTTTGSVSGTTKVGGIVGSSFQSFIQESDSFGVISGTQSVGGIVGDYDGDAVSSVYANATVSGTTEVGGVIGSMETDNGATFQYIYADGSVTGTSSKVGGLIGYIDMTSDGGTSISDDFSVASVHGVSQTGGLVGMVANGTVDTVNDDYYDKSATGQTVCDSANTMSCTGVNADGSQASYFFNNTQPPLTNWDFIGTWQTDGSSLPTLGLPTPPSAPKNVTWTSTATGVTLNWSAPASQGSAAVNDYYLQYEITGSGNWTTFIHSATTTSSAAVTGLTTGDSYNFRLADVNSVGIGGYANVSNIYATDTPSAPGSVVLTPTSNTTATLAWTAPANAATAAPNGYQVVVNGVTRTVSATPLSFDLSGLTVGEALNITVAAINQNGAVGTAATYTTTDFVGVSTTTTANQSSSNSKIASTSKKTAAVTTLIGNDSSGSVNFSIDSGAPIILNNYDDYVSGLGQQETLAIGQAVYFDIVKADGSEEQHSATVTSVTDDTATIVFHSSPVTETLSLAQTKYVDVTGDGQPDIAATLSGTLNGQAIVIFKQPAKQEARDITTPITTIPISQLTSQPSNENWFYFCAGVFLALAVVAFMFEKRKLRKQH
jgi:hypothetical protein